MSVAFFVTLWRVELSKLLRRVSSWFGLGTAASVGVLGAVAILTFGLFTAGTAEVAAQEPMVRPPPDWSIGHAVEAAFLLRGLLVYPLTLIILTSICFAGELRSKTLREDLLRPVPRWALGLAKYLALVCWVTLAIALSTGFAAGTWTIAWALANLIDTQIFGPDPISLFGTSYTAWDYVLPVLLTFIAECTFVAIAVAVATLTRSVSATLGIVVFLAIGQVGVDTVLNLLFSELQPNRIGQLAAFTGLPFELLEWVLWFAVTIWPWQPPYILFPSSPTWQSLLMAGLLLAGSLAVGVWRLQRTDLP